MFCGHVFLGFMFVINFVGNVVDLGVLSIIQRKVINNSQNNNDDLVLLAFSVDVLIFENPKIKSWIITNNEIGISLYIVVWFWIALANMKLWH